MATHDYNLANQDGASFRSDLNNALAAIVSNNSSSTAPATTFAHQIWVDTTANVIKQRNAANDAWIELWRIDGGFNAKTFSSNVTLNAQSDLRFADSDSSNWVAFQAPATVASNVTWTLPSADGTADQALTTNGSGVLSWADAGGTTDNITEGNTSAEVVDTGSDGHFKVITEGTEALRVDSSQRVGIGTANPRARLSISGASGTDGINLYDNGGNYRTGIGGDINSLRFYFPSSGSGGIQFGTLSVSDGSTFSESGRFDSSGRLLVGTSTARSNFFNTSLTALQQIEDLTSPRSAVISSSDVGGRGGALILAHQRSGTIGGNTVLNSGDNIGIVSFQGNDGTEFVEGAKIEALVDGTPGANDMPGRLVFSTTADGASSPTEAMRLTSSGDLRFNSGYGSVATAYGCRAWVNFRGTSTVLINGSGNVSSITDHAAGQYSINFSNSMPDGNYCYVGAAGNFDTATTNQYAAIAGPRATTSQRMFTQVSGSVNDALNITVAIFR